jgi:hypothetical protein
MNAITIVAVTLYAVVGITLGMNILQVFKESKQLKADGKTPLMGRNLTVVACAAVGEALVVLFLIWLFSKLLPGAATVWSVLVMFVFPFLLRNVGAYLVAWGLWSLFVTIDKKKMKEQIEKDKETAL